MVLAKLHQDFSKQLSLKRLWGSLLMILTVIMIITAFIFGLLNPDVALDSIFNLIMSTGGMGLVFFGLTIPDKIIALKR
jgi:hypothetical protein